jgi:hypothetical protein
MGSACSRFILVGFRDPDGSSEIPFGLSYEMLGCCDSNYFQRRLETAEVLPLPSHLGSFVFASCLHQKIQPFDVLDQVEISGVKKDQITKEVERLLVRIMSLHKSLKFRTKSK